MKKNNFYLGAFLGLIAPLFAYLLTINELFLADKPLAFFAVAGLVNLLIMRYFYHSHLSKSAQGVIISTFIALLILLFLANLI